MFGGHRINRKYEPPLLSTAQWACLVHGKTSPTWEDAYGKRDLLVYSLKMCLLCIIMLFTCYKYMCGTQINLVRVVSSNAHNTTLLVTKFSNNAITIVHVQYRHNIDNFLIVVLRLSGHVYHRNNKTISIHNIERKVFG